MEKKREKFKDIECPYCSKIYQYSVEENVSYGPMPSFTSIRIFNGKKELFRDRPFKVPDTMSVKCPSCDKIFEFEIKK